MNPLAGIAHPLATDAVVSDEYTQINSPDHPHLDIVVLNAGTVQVPVLKGINRINRHSILHIPPSVADSVMLPSVEEVV